jgi:hypothetical protein
MSTSLYLIGDEVLTSHTGGGNARLDMLLSHLMIRILDGRTARYRELSRELTVLEVARRYAFF